MHLDGFNFEYLTSRTAVWKFLLAIIVVQLVLAFVAYAIVRAGAERDASEYDDVPEGAEHSM